MGDLEASIAAETQKAQREARCQVSRYGYDWGLEWECWEHGRISYVREECAVIGPAVAAAVRAGWDAAINAAAEKAEAMAKLAEACESSVLNDYLVAETYDAAAEHIRSLLSEGGDRG